MRQLVEAFPAQLEEALRISASLRLQKTQHAFQNVVIAGLGGSGIGGTIVTELAFPHAKIPIAITKGYFIPDYVNEHTLFIVSSYSGNTEETLACYELAETRKAHIVCITSGGTIAQKAKQGGHDLILIPGGRPPRACLGYSFVQLLAIFTAHQLLPPTLFNQIESSVALLRSRQEQIQVQAAEVASLLFNHIPVIYSTTSYEGVAIRFRQQINENAKMLCWHHVIPEMNHNELVGWAGGDKRFAVVLFKDPDEYERNEFRIAINKDIITKKADHFIEISAQGNTVLEKIFWLIHLGDWISVELAHKNGVDAVEVNVINYLKDELSKK
jgi:glucose/mannose-6-phosphate isomerase